MGKQIPSQAFIAIQEGSRTASETDEKHRVNMYTSRKLQCLAIIGPRSNAISTVRQATKQAALETRWERKLNMAVAPIPQLREYIVALASDPIRSASFSRMEDQFRELATRLPLVHVLRVKELVQDKTYRQKVFESIDQLQLIAKRPRVNSEMTETSCGWKPSVYFFIGRCHPDGTDIVFMLDRKGCPLVGATPFDSGGMFHGLIASTPDEPPMSPIRIQRIKESNVSGNDLIDTMACHLAFHFQSIKSYYSSGVADWPDQWHILTKNTDLPIFSRAWEYRSAEQVETTGDHRIKIFVSHQWIEQLRRALRDKFAVSQADSILECMKAVESFDPELDIEDWIQATYAS